MVQEDVSFYPISLEEVEKKVARKNGRRINNKSVKSKCYREVSLLDLVGGNKRNMFMNPSRLITLNDRHLDLDQIKSHFPNHSICYYDYSGLNKLLSYD